MDSNLNASVNFPESISMPITITNLVCDLFYDTIPHLVEGDFVFVPYVNFLPIDEDDYNKIVYVRIRKTKFGRKKFNTWRASMKLDQSI
jgi:hypothetical protein